MIRDWDDPDQWRLRKRWRARLAERVRRAERELVPPSQPRPTVESRIRIAVWPQEDE